MQTSFKKKPRGTTPSSSIPGTRPSLHNGQLLCSTGVPSLDAVIGGGIPVGTVFMLIEDQHCQYSNLLTRYYLAEAVMSGHDLFLGTTDDGSSFMRHLPDPILLEEETKQSSSDEMKIAWRYQNSPQVQTSMGQHSKYGNYYDISKTMDEKHLNNARTKIVNLSQREDENDTENFDMFKRLLRSLHDHISRNNFNIQAAAKSKRALNVLRVAVPNFGSPFWGCLGGANKNIHDIVKFLNCLRTIARTSLLTCWLTVPAHLYSQSDIEFLVHNVDTVIKLEAFGSNKSNPLYKDYHGLLKIQKLPVLNSLLPYTPDSQDLAFKLKRKKFTIERLHLPPDISETASRQGVEESSGRICGGSKAKNPIDF